MSTQDVLDRLYYVLGMQMNKWCKDLIKIQRRNKEISKGRQEWAIQRHGN